MCDFHCSSSFLTTCFLSYNTAWFKKKNELANWTTTTQSQKKIYKWLGNSIFKMCSKSLANKEMQTKTTLRFHFPTIRMAIVRNISDNQWGERGTHTLDWEYILVQPLCILVQKFPPKKLQMKLPYSSDTPWLEVYPKVFISYYRDPCTNTFTATLITIAGEWNQPRYPLTNSWRNKMW